MKAYKSGISALLITYNEIDCIEGAIKNLSFADEIIVIDSFSTDGTYQKLQTFPQVKIIQRAFKNFADQRNFAIKQASKEWILFTDPDEYIPDNLRDEILNAVKNTDNINAYKIKRNLVTNNKTIRFSGMQTDTIFRLFKNGKALYNPNIIVHEQLVVSGKTGMLNGSIKHYSFKSLAHFKLKIEHYNRLRALELYKKGKKGNAVLYFAKAVYKFIYNYIIRLGFLDGSIGYYICKINGLGVWHRYITLKSYYKLPPE